MGASACKCCVMNSEDADVEEDNRKYKKPRLEEKEQSKPECDHTSAVLGNPDLLGIILRTLGDRNGLTMEQRGIICQVNCHWAEVSKRMPVQIAFNEPMSSLEIKTLKAGIPGLQSLEFAGQSERHAESIISSWAVQEVCSGTLERIVNLPSRTLNSIEKFVNLRELSICRCGGIHVMEMIQGIVYDLKQLAHLHKLETLSLKEIGSPQTSIINFEYLPSGLKHLRLEDTSLVHHPELTLPDIDLETLHVSATKNNKIVVPIELVSKARTTTMKGHIIHLTGPPISVPTMEEDTLEVIMGHGVLLLLSIGVERTEHETDLVSILTQLRSDTFQSLSIEMEPKPGNEISLVSRSDCRKDMKWKALETVNSPDFILEATKLCQSPSLGLEMHEEQVNGKPQLVRLIRSG